MSPKVIKVNPFPDYKLELLFSSGEKKLFDVKPYLKYPVYKELQITENFIDTHICNGTVCWGSDGFIDFDPDRLYLDSVLLS